MSAFESIKQGLEEAKKFSKGRGARAIVHEIPVPAINVAEVRAGTGVSQSDVAKGIGAFSRNTQPKDFDGCSREIDVQ